MQETIQEMLDFIQRRMEESSRFQYSGPAATRALHTLVAVLARRYFTDEQQEQVERLLDLHTDCLRRNGEIKR